MASDRPRDTLNRSVVDRANVDRSAGWVNITAEEYAALPKVMWAGRVVSTDILGVLAGRADEHLSCLPPARTCRAGW